jgi:hypothetical protein
MAHVHLRILEFPQAKTLGGPTSAVHCFGSANLLADAVSRGNMECFHALCAQLGVAPFEMQVPLSGRILLDDAVAYARLNSPQIGCTRTTKTLYLPAGQRAPLR